MRPSLGVVGPLALTAAVLVGASAVPATASATTLTSGSVSAQIDTMPWRFTLRREGRTLLREAGGRGPGATGALGFRSGGRWWRATRAVAGASGGGSLTALLATTDPAGRRLGVELRPDGRGAIRLQAVVVGGPVADVEAVGIAFAAPAGERHLGFGERSNAVDQRGWPARR